MIDNNLYNLMEQFVQECKSLWRMKDAYIEDSNNEEVKEFWEEMIKDKEKHLEDLKELVKKHL